MSELTPIPGFLKLTGPPYVGITAAIFLFGLFTLQFYNYVLKFRNDYLILKLAVYAVFILELVSTGMTVADGYHWFVRGFGKPDVLAGFFLANFDTPIMGSFVAMISQTAYCWRIYRLSGMKILPIAILAVVIGSEACYLAVGVVNQTIIEIGNWGTTSTRLVIVWVVGNVASDNIIAFMMVYLLLNNTSLRNASWLGRIVRLILESNTLSAVVAIALASFTFIDSLKPPNTSMFLAPGYVMSKLYSNCMLIMLNNRMYAGDIGEESADFGIGGHAIPLRPRYVQTFEKVVVSKEMAVHVDDISEVPSAVHSTQHLAGPEVRFSEV
ncbi:hypothetical protein AGABI1DRAFT_129391 [Agaricus bisporus var. burnettii JB137-S8]|uniref:DUF6534 domain-containing protein n=2 Tax=Agaricus bisporus var. burnettii TaxID=192524 RepID=K5X5Q2_AGABU|nr:uncharacterized protein AGABI1DRAFT_129391 [Agaricus bisporus var. burnettii JB137-S8]EKM78272.1 hypothetical protein AGABI1DRAFT_129391 [Agaricus bisporus var. burnettii JB137-S8]KAF7762438.1 hypothetical protein Agabi119p4_9031 [Agaricus bisporus var. burnettii]